MKTHKLLMRNLENSFASTHRFFLLIILSMTLGVVGCSKDKEVEKIVPETGYSLVFNVDGIEEPLVGEDISDLNKTSSTKGLSSDRLQKFASSRMGRSLQTGKGGQLLAINEIEGDDFDAIATIRQEGAGLSKTVSLGKTERSDKVAQTSPTNPASTTNKMLVNNLYGVLIYEMVNGNPVYKAKIDGIAGTKPAPIVVDAGKTYKWYAYSYDNKTRPVINNTAAPSIPTKVMSDILIAQGTISPTKFGANEVNITFKRKMAAIAVEIDARGMYAALVTTGKFTTMNLNSPLQKADYSIFGDSFSNFTAETNPVIDGSTWMRANTTSLDTIIVAQFYTPMFANPVVENQSLAQVDLTLNKFGINRDNNTTLEFVSPRQFLLAAQTISPKQGFRTKITVSLLMSGIDYQPKSGTSIATDQLQGAPLLKFARGLLHYENSSKAYTIRHVQNTAYNNPTDNTTIKVKQGSGDFFNFGAADAKGSSRHGATFVDPCKLVFPAGRYRMPTSAELLNLSRSIANSSAQNYNVATNYIAGSYRQITATQGGNVDGIQVGPNGSNIYGDFSKIGFYRQGYRDVDGVSFPEILTGETGSSNFWSSDGNATTAKALRLNRVITSASGAPTVIASTSGVFDTDSNRGLNIRCIRN